MWYFHKSVNVYFWFSEQHDIFDFIKIQESVSCLTYMMNQSKAYFLKTVHVRATFLINARMQASLS